MNEYEKILYDKLQSEFDKETVNKVSLILKQTAEEFNQVSVNNGAENINHPINKFINALGENPEVLKGIVETIKKPNWVSLIKTILTSLIVIIPITTLSMNGILGTCETSTLFGGIIGYLLSELK